ncbi:MAG: CoA transferase [Chloroflexi bacterium]|nr:CoA transferase [Chloroflexota bacterium]
MLSPYRVLDLTTTAAAIGPMMLADMGADVVRVEPPLGSPGRHQPPLDPGGEPSLHFHAFNRNKRGVTLDLDSPAGQAAFRALVPAADFLFEDARPGVMAARGLGVEALHQLNPQLVYVATTPFGQDGPYAAHATSDITLAAMGGMVALNGDADRPPVRMTVPQTWLHAGAESAMAAMVGHFRRLQTGMGQFIDVSVQASVFWTGLNAMIAHAVTGKDIERAGTLLQLGIVNLPLVFPAKDGEVVLAPTGGTMAGLVAKMVEDGVVPASWLTGEDWPTYDLRFLTGQPVTIAITAACEAIGRFTSRYAKAELLDWGLAHGVTMAPVSTNADVLAFPHLAERKYWQPYTLPGGREIRIPGPFVRLEKTPLSIRRQAPAFGEHTAEVQREWATLRPAAASLPPTAKAPLPFEGLKVADFSWIGVGPITAKYFADHGATVVRVEAGAPVDRLRGAGPHKDGIPGTNRSQFFASFNTSKKGINLNLKDPAGQAIARRLLAWCDVAFESFTPGTMSDLGLSYETAKELNPNIVMVSTCLMGQTGPAARLAGYGYHAAAISGFFEVTGWPDRDPGGPFNAYTDVIAPHFLGATVAAALDHRRRTGQGQHIEQAQMESALYFLAPEVLETQVTGAMPRRAGNDSPYFAPHNVYPCLGDDQWIAIAVETDEQWRALRGALGNPGWAMDARYETASGRLAHHDAIDEQIGEFTFYQDRYDLMELLQRGGVPAGAVQRSSDLLRDPQLAHRNFFRPLVHPEMGEIPYEGHMFRIAGYDSGARFPAPCLGEHSAEVLTEILGMTDDELAEALTSGAVA